MKQSYNFQFVYETCHQTMTSKYSNGEILCTEYVWNIHGLHTVAYSKWFSYDLAGGKKILVYTYKPF